MLRVGNHQDEAGVRKDYLQIERSSKGGFSPKRPSWRGIVKKSMEKAKGEKEACSHSGPSRPTSIYSVRRGPKGSLALT